MNQVIEGINRTPVLGIRLTCPDNLHRLIRTLKDGLKALDITRNQISAFVTCKTARPDDGEVVWIKKPSRLVSHLLEQQFLKFTLTLGKGLDIAGYTRSFQLLINPVFFILRIGHMINLTYTLVSFPHFTGNLTVKFGYRIRFATQTQSS